MKFFETPLNKTDALMGCPLHWKSESLPSLKNKAFFQEMIPKKFQISKILSTIIICVSLIYETTLENTESLEPHDSPLMYWLMLPPPHHHTHTHKILERALPAFTTPVGNPILYGISIVWNLRKVWQNSEKFSTWGSILNTFQSIVAFYTIVGRGVLTPLF